MKTKCSQDYCNKIFLEIFSSFKRCFKTFLKFLTFSSNKQEIHPLKRDFSSQFNIMGYSQFLVVLFRTLSDSLSVKVLALRNV